MVFIQLISHIVSQLQSLEAEPSDRLTFLIYDLALRKLRTINIHIHY